MSQPTDPLAYPDDAHAAVRQEALRIAMAPALEPLWSETAPTEPGIYAWAYGETDEVSVVCLSRGASGMLEAAWLPGWEPTPYGDDTRHWGPRLDMPEHPIQPDPEPPEPRPSSVAEACEAALNSMYPECVGAIKVEAKPQIQPHPYPKLAPPFEDSISTQQVHYEPQKSGSEIGAEKRRMNDELVAEMGATLRCSTCRGPRAVRPGSCSSDFHGTPTHDVPPPPEVQRGVNYGELDYRGPIQVTRDEAGELKHEFTPTAQAIRDEEGHLEPPLTEAELERLRKYHVEHATFSQPNPVMGLTPEQQTAFNELLSRSTLDRRVKP